MPPVLQRLTTTYCEHEDRIRLAGAAPREDPVLIWLTRRLLDRLLPVLVAWLEGTVDEADAKSRAMQSFAQQAARAGLQPQPPVRATPESAVWLAHKVDVRQTGRNVTLLLSGADGKAATVTLAARPLRQWLGIVHDLYRRADWPLAVWPAWLRDEETPVDRQEVVMH